MRQARSYMSEVRAIGTLPLVARKKHEHYVHTSRSKILVRVALTCFEQAVCLPAATRGKGRNVQSLVALMLSIRVVFWLAGLTAVAAAPVASGDDAARDHIDFFEANIRPVLVKSCYPCHSEEAEISARRVVTFKPSKIFKNTLQ